MNEYYQSLPKKRIGAGAIFSNKDGQILVVKPNYRDRWLIPGGVVEQDESPRSGCSREIKEEIGLEIDLSEPVCIDYKSSIDNKPEVIHFLFDAGVISEKQIQEIALQEDELSEYRFVHKNDLMGLLEHGLRERVIEYLKDPDIDKCIYLENQKKV
jgi:ADP-ribose pyrophosphatase YjhB (NUDIX family)